MFRIQHNINFRRRYSTDRVFINSCAVRELKSDFVHKCKYPRSLTSPTFNERGKDELYNQRVTINHSDIATQRRKN